MPSARLPHDRARTILSETRRAFTAEDAAGWGVPPWTLSRMAADGDLYRVAQGVYLPGSMAPDHRTAAAEASLRFPGTVVCLRSAAELHGLTTEVRDEAFLAMPSDFRPKSLRLGNAVDGHREIRWVRWAGPSLEIGVETVEVHGVAVKVTGPARTVVDYFRYRGGRDGGGKRGLFGRDEILDVLDRHLAGRNADDELMRIAAEFGMRDFIEPILDGRRALTTRTFRGV